MMRTTGLKKTDILKKRNDKCFMKGVIQFYAFFNGKSYQQAVENC